MNDLRRRWDAENKKPREAAEIEDRANIMAYEQALSQRISNLLRLGGGLSEASLGIGGSTIGAALPTIYEILNKRINKTKP